MFWPIGGKLPTAARQTVKIDKTIDRACKSSVLTYAECCVIIRTMARAVAKAQNKGGMPQAEKVMTAVKESAETLYKDLTHAGDRNLESTYDVNAAAYFYYVYHDATVADMVRAAATNKFSLSSGSSSLALNLKDARITNRIANIFSNLPDPKVGQRESDRYLDTGSEIPNGAWD